MKALAFLETVIITISFFFGSLFNLPDKKIERSGGFIYGVCHPNENDECLPTPG